MTKFVFSLSRILFDRGEVLLFWTYHCWGFRICVQQRCIRKWRWIQRI